MGDNIDCAGVFGKTARLDHDMPENMDVREQANSYITLVLWFIESMICEENRLCSSVKVYSVPCGNHGGNFEYMCNKALLAYINACIQIFRLHYGKNFSGYLLRIMRHLYVVMVRMISI